MTPGEYIHALTEKKALLAFKRAADRTNYQILKSLPTTAKEVMSLTGLSKMPTYRRIKDLREVGLIDHKKRERGENLNPTELTVKVLKGIEQMKKPIGENLPELLLKTSL